jgi:tRNA(fMet)-specific endonuclease VapC
MPQFLFDTDHLTLFDRGHPKLQARMAQQPPDVVALCAPPWWEALRGRMASVAKHLNGPALIVAYSDLIRTTQVLQLFPLADYDQAADHEYQRLRALGLRIGTQDLRIASVALAQHLTVLTRNSRDFGLVPGLTIEDWST